MHVEKKSDVASKSINFPMTSSENAPEVASTARMLLSPKKTHPTLHPLSKAE